MRFSFRKTSNGAALSSGSGLALLMLFAVLVPSICLLWFMDRAVQNERFAVRQKLVDVYRANLLLAQERLQSHWRQLADDLESQAGKVPAPVLVAREVGAGSADALVCFDADGLLLYPDAPNAPVLEKLGEDWSEARRLESRDSAAAASADARLAAAATDANSAARALQAQARCLLQTGDQTAAISLLTGALADPRYRQATDSQGRLLVPNAQLLALELLKVTAPEQSREVRERLQTRLLDYGDPAMTASQRRFLTRELRKLFPETPVYPMFAAEDLAAQWIAAGATAPREPFLRASALAGVWQFASRGGQVLTLHRTENLAARLRDAASHSGLPPDARVDFFAPGQEVEGALVSLPVGPSMPGWRMGLSLRDQRVFDSATNQRITSYVWIGGLVIVVVVVLALLAWGLVRRQHALTQLRDDLVANVTHELKTPLASMRLFVETLLRAPQLHEATAREYLQLIARENLRLSRLIDNFLTFSRIERNKYVFSFKETSASAIAESAAAAVRERFETPDCRFEVTIPANLPCVTADGDALVTALVNLLDNAWKYSGDAKQIALTAGTQNGSVNFAVRDNGIGLSPRDAKRVFQRFYQVHQHLSPTTGGCGLGLSIVQFIVSAHRGAVRVDSTPGRGSTFTVTLPISGAPRSLP